MVPLSHLEVTGVILAGGRARRMGGRDKGLIPLAGKPMVSHAIEALAPQVGQVIINANRHLEDYRRWNHDVVEDDSTIGDFCGPLAGVLAAMEHSDRPWLLTVPCDSPLLAGDYAQRMIQGLTAAQGVIAVASSGERLQPVFALLQRALAADLRRYLVTGGRKIDQWFAEHRAATVDFSDRPEMFRNVNTPEDLQALEGELGV
ncbi:MAG: molybdenum cofactor guanylyltransferase MobA [Candidatus Competibacterales bacterium]